jgi:hypothetical protein
MFNPKVKEGDRIVCIQMQGESDTVPVGTKGTVQRIVKTPFGEQIEVNWENGSTLSLLMDEDVWMLESNLNKKFLLDPPLGPKEPKKDVDNDVIKEDLKKMVLKNLKYIVE